MNKIDSNKTGLSYAIEDTPGVVAAPVWKDICPNSYSDFGGDIKNVSRKCIEPSRQRKKGTVVDIDANGGFNIDVTKSNVLDLMQGFLFADAHEKVDSKPLNGTEVVITAIDGSTEQYNAASGLGVFLADDLIHASGFSNAQNNGLKIVVSSTATDVTVNEDLATETSPPTSRIQVVGKEFPASDLDLAASASLITITSATKDFTTLGLSIGEWVFIGGDAVGSRFVNNVGFARISAITTSVLSFDNTTFTAVTETGTAKTIQLFFGTFIRNEKVAALIKQKTYQLERLLGEDLNGTMSEYLVGSYPSELTINIPVTDKLNADMAFISLDNVQRDGLTGPKAGAHIESLDENAINTSSDVYRQKLSIYDPANLNNPALFGFVSEASISIKNNIEPLKAIGVLGAFDASVGDFEVDGSITAYFTTIDGVQAVRNNSDVGFDTIFTSGNAGQVFDIPLISLGNGRLNVEIDSAITLPLDTMGVENANGYSMSYTNMAYLPDIATN